MHIVACRCLESITMINVDGNPQCQVRYDPSELLAFSRRDFPHMNLLCERAQMFEDRIVKRTSEILRYFGLPAPS